MPLHQDGGPRWTEILAKVPISSLPSLFLFSFCFFLFFLLLARSLAASRGFVFAVFYSWFAHWRKGSCYEISMSDQTEATSVIAWRAPRWDWTSRLEPDALPCAANRKPETVPPPRPIGLPRFTSLLPRTSLPSSMKKIFHATQPPFDASPCVPFRFSLSFVPRTPLQLRVSMSQWKLRAEITRSGLERSFG